MRKKIDQGLASSRFGVVILSPRFFEKHWPEQELNGLSTREVNGQKVILPVWHKVDFDAVRRYSPTLADRIAVNTDKGLPYVIDKLMEAMKAAPRMVDYKIFRMGGAEVGIRPESDRAVNRTGKSVKGLIHAFKTGHEASQYVKAGEAEGYTFEGKEFLAPFGGVTGQREERTSYVGGLRRCASLGRAGSRKGKIQRPRSSSKAHR